LIRQTDRLLLQNEDRISVTVKAATPKMHALMTHIASDCKYCFTSVQLEMKYLLSTRLSVVVDQWPTLVHFSVPRERFTWDMSGGFITKTTQVN
jgi:hypothetical protein